MRSEKQWVHIPVKIEGYRFGPDVGRKDILKFLECYGTRTITVNKHNAQSQLGMREQSNVSDTSKYWNAIQ